ncbi:MAG TPA: ATP-binding protein [Bacteroidales bacterium]|nr:ATP-binding protein [Bacteroidales bacterium]
MITSVLKQQRAERDYLLGQRYIDRLDRSMTTELLNSELIKLISGPRRAGKSVMAINMLKDQEFAYLNFDDDQLLSAFNEDEVISGLKEVYGNYHYLLLDEIQNLNGWEIWVNKLARRGTNLVITGSNARLLSRELATSLTGRYTEIKVWPFSFREMLHYNSKSMESETANTPSDQGVMLHALNQYLTHGGFPEVVRNPEMRNGYLSTLFDSLILKDILKRFQVRQTKQLYDLASWMITNYTNPFTYNQLKNDLQFNSVATVQKFCGYLTEAFLQISLPAYATKQKLHQRKPQKVYVIDNGYVGARSFEQSPNLGHLLENMILVELMRRGNQPGFELFYHRTKNNKEIDFLVRQGHLMYQLIQVCFDLSSLKTRKRELSALTEASVELRTNNLLIITWNHEEIIPVQDTTIRVIPAWKWLLEK